MDTTKRSKIKTGLAHLSKHGYIPHRAADSHAAVSKSRCSTDALAVLQETKAMLSQLLCHNTHHEHPTHAAFTEAVQLAQSGYPGLDYCSDTTTVIVKSHDEQVRSYRHQALGRRRYTGVGVYDNDIDVLEDVAVKAVMEPNVMFGSLRDGMPVRKRINALRFSNSPLRDDNVLTAMLEQHKPRERAVQVKLTSHAAPPVKRAEIAKQNALALLDKSEDDKKNKSNRPNITPRQLNLSPQPVNVLSANQLADVETAVMMVEQHVDKEHIAADEHCILDNNSLPPRLEYCRLPADIQAAQRSLYTHINNEITAVFGDAPAVVMRLFNSICALYCLDTERPTVDVHTQSMQELSALHARDMYTRMV